MKNLKAVAATVLLFVALFPIKCFAQNKKPIPSCSQAVFAALKPLPN